MRDRISNTLCKKTYKLISPLGEEIIIKSITRFCKENNLPLYGLQKVIYGERDNYKGWTGKILCNVL
jgi:hypothetical protein